ncbi:hypothetical protein M378DRAFT_170003 [Amanita muscaria Koide BX008]|uniref:Uncharacterized protein n=1 Tax=Amanita muscaria (strain Koide BX008) TaxID=946122 RepID=A0A0C2WQC5_AMAMK|nr:hypothetical protein M378DRAFT_170003 [Amanita muscaria Koide BX008]
MGANTKVAVRERSVRERLERERELGKLKAVKCSKGERGQRKGRQVQVMRRRRRCKPLIPHHSPHGTASGLQFGQCNSPWIFPATSDGGPVDGNEHFGGCGT